MSNAIITQELEALQAIYSTDFTTTTLQKPWNVILHQHSILLSSRHIPPLQIQFTFSYPQKYPYQLPSFSLHSNSGLDLRLLESQLHALAQKLLGQEMIYDLANSIQDYLFNIQEKNSHGLSLHEKMATRLEKEQIEKSQLRSELDMLHKNQSDSLLASEIEKELLKKKELRAQILKKKPETEILEPKSLSDSLENLVLDNKLLLQDPSASRYQSDFDEIEFLGRGAYGSVVKVRNKIDARFYAIKKIKLDPGDQESSKKILREVQALSRLYHQYVVRYYQAWFEKMDGSPWVSSLQDDPNASFSSSDSDLLESHSKDWISHSSSFGYIDFAYSSNSRISNLVENSSTSSSQIVLYIQMEYCEKKTLRDVIDAGPLSDQESWRLFRQILEGLNHIHQQGMIHRDLKPSNIFLDREGNVKIGDFGLATVRDESHVTSPLHSQNLAIQRDPSLTHDIGTPVYIAPEVIEYGKLYDSKVDMYSLGVLFFEMCYPMSTGMQRAMVLEELRKTSKLPKNFNHALFEKQGKIIKDLLSPMPHNRPTCQTLLNSPLLPVFMEEQHVKEALRSLTTPLNYSRLISSIFDRKNDPHKDFSYDFNSTGSLIDITMCLISTRMQAHALKVFSRHGAVHFSGPLLFLKNESIITNPSKSPVTMVDSSGDLVQLPWDLTVPFARTISRTLASDSRLSQFKRFAIERVYRPNTVGGQPRSILECDFDIVSRTLDDVLSEAEGKLHLQILLSLVIKTFFQLLDWNGAADHQEYIIRLNDCSLLDLILQSCKIPKERRIPLLLEQIHSGSHFGESKNRFWSAGVSSESFSLLEKFNLEITSATSFSDLIKKHLDSDSFDLAKKPIHRLVALSKHLVALGIRSKICFCPLMVYNYHYYKGQMMFQIQYSPSNASTKKMDVVAAGGRYDALLSTFQFPSGPLSLHAVGIHIAFSKLVMKAASQHAKKSRQSPSTTNFETNPLLRKSQILVSSYGSPEGNPERLNLANELWEANFSVDISQSSDLTMELLQASSLGYQFLVMVKSRPDSTAVVYKLKNLQTQAELELSRIELVPYLNIEISQGGTPADSPATPLKTKLVESTRKGSVHVIESSGTTSKRPRAGSSRNNTKSSMIIEKASSSVEKSIHQIQKLPIFAMDLSIKDLKKLQMVDFMSEKEKCEGFSQSQRESIGGLIRHLRKLHETVKMNQIWIYSTLDGTSFLLHL